MTHTVQDVISILDRTVRPAGTTVDGIITGDANQSVQAVVVSFVASHTVIQKAIQLGANMVITHEGPFYEHNGNRSVGSEADDDPVIQKKKELIDAHGLVLYRFHDGPHEAVPDTITNGLLHALGWEKYDHTHLKTAVIITLPNPASTQEIGAYLKTKLNLPYVRLVGEREQKCSKIALAVGYRGGAHHAIPLYEKEQLDLLITGEGPEWETPEYILDAVKQGNQKSLIFLGHAASEDPGMIVVAQKIRDRFPNLPVHFIKADPYIMVL
ncbi:Nif3-like dinuclear metal center hexameric protein [Paenibacillus sp. Marseille-Q4541]|uniref:Nif3-like dinuclear metal center hexameric protein n=1 Tax=Paenibacillus sp. Marseille-Q4541 TaxID=2831522 RepID=UPI001BA9AD56|nr:Nif3-like dinuclear metal center hexameric protein [Paenibacillus sp. Marseille-Q4541]